MAKRKTEQSAWLEERAGCIDCCQVDVLHGKIIGNGEENTAVLGGRSPLSVTHVPFNCLPELFVNNMEYSVYNSIWGTLFRRLVFRLY